MSRPHRHPKTGVYYLRKRVPTRLIDLVGRAVVKISLHTKDPAEARRRHAMELAKLERSWATLQAGFSGLSPLEINVMAGDFYRSIVAGYEKGPLPFFGMMAWSSAAAEFVDAPNDETAHGRFLSMLGPRIDAYLDETGIRIDPTHRGALDYGVARAVLDATERGVEFLDGNFGEDARAKRYADPSPKTKPVPALEAFDEYAEAANLSAATVKRWKPAVTAFVAHCRHDDLTRVSPDDVASWIADLRASARAPRTIRDVYVAAVKAVYGWLRAEKGFRQNPFEGFRVKVPDRKKLRSPDLSDDEARTILTASLAVQPARLSPQHRAARRWVPWLAAYSGARVNELTQLRVKDILKKDGVWVMEITPDAGSVKTGEARHVPLHPHVVDQGFLDFVKSVRSGPLFYVTNPNSSASPANPPYKKMGERLAAWVRQLGVEDVGVDPNHGWRHRFKTVGRQARIQDHILDVI